MDPRDAAKVTAPDLVSAFNEGRGFAGGEEPVETKVWVVFIQDDEVQRVVEYPLTQLDVALADAKALLQSTPEAGVLIFTGTEEPAIVGDAREAALAISAPPE